MIPDTKKKQNKTQNTLNLLSFSVFKHQQQNASVLDELPIVVALAEKNLAGVKMQTALGCQRCRAVKPVLWCQGHADLREIRILSSRKVVCFLLNYVPVLCSQFNSCPSLHLTPEPYPLFLRNHDLH